MTASFANLHKVTLCPVDEGDALLLMCSCGWCRDAGEDPVFDEVAASIRAHRRGGYVPGWGPSVVSMGAGSVDQ